ncbi:MAG: DUF2007 domain-containing protein [Psychroflexus sp.]|nr:DUF2007 domain-containing protein [Psychroflexus sp.]
MENYVVLARFTYTYEYAVLKLLLDKAEILYYFKNEHFASILPINAIGNNGILLMVHQKDQKEAKQILEDFYTSDSPLKLI